MIDVTVPVQCQVKDSRLFLTESSKVGPWEWAGVLCCEEIRAFLSVYTSVKYLAIIHRTGGEQRWILTSPLRGSVNIRPPLSPTLR